MAETVCSRGGARPGGRLSRRAERPRSPGRRPATARHAGNGVGSERRLPARRPGRWRPRAKMASFREMPLLAARSRHPEIPPALAETGFVSASGAPRGMASFRKSRSSARSRHPEIPPGLAETGFVSGKGAPRAMASFRETGPHAGDPACRSHATQARKARLRAPRASRRYRRARSRSGATLSRTRVSTTRPSILFSNTS